MGRPLRVGLVRKPDTKRFFIWPILVRILVLICSLNVILFFHIWVCHNDTGLEFIDLPPPVEFQKLCTNLFTVNFIKQVRRGQSTLDPPVSPAKISNVRRRGKFSPDKMSGERKFSFYFNCLSEC